MARVDAVNPVRWRRHARTDDVAIVVPKRERDRAVERATNGAKCEPVVRTALATCDCLGYPPGPWQTRNQDVANAGHPAAKHRKEVSAWQSGDRRDRSLLLSETNSHPLSGESARERRRH